MLNHKNNTKQWGSRFNSAPSLIMKEINASISYDKRLYQQDIRASITHAKMLAKQGILNADEAEQIINGLKEIIKEFASDKISINLEMEDIHTHVEMRLKEKIGNLAGKLHTARSRNDQVVTDLRLWLRDQIDNIDKAIISLCRALSDVASKHTNTLIAGLTHMQIAQPVSFGQHLMAHAQVFFRDHQRLIDCRKRVNISPLGAAALAGTSFNIDRHFTAKDLGFDTPMANSIDAVSTRDFILEFLSFAAIHSVHLSRLAEEMVLWNSNHIGYIQFSDAFSTGSSIMPQKRNPDAAELIRAKPGRIIGHLVGLLSVIKALPLTYSKDLQEDKEPLFDSVDTLYISLSAMTGMIYDMKINVQAMYKKLTTGFPTATDLADWLVSEKGITFREAHQFSGAIVKIAEQKGVSIADLELYELQQVTPIIDEKIYSILSLENSLQSRRSFGGVSPEMVKLQIINFQKYL